MLENVSVKTYIALKSAVFKRNKLKHIDQKEFLKGGIIPLYYAVRTSYRHCTYFFLQSKNTGKYGNKILYRKWWHLKIYGIENLKKP